MAGCVQDREVGAPGRIRKQGEDARRGMGIGVVPRAERARHDALTVIGKERHRVLAGDGVQPHQNLVTSVLVKSHTPDVTGGHRHLSDIRCSAPIDRPSPIVDPDNQVDDGGKVRRCQCRNDGLTSGRHLRGGEDAHDNRPYPPPRRSVGGCRRSDLTRTSPGLTWPDSQPGPPNVKLDPQRAASPDRGQTNDRWLTRIRDLLHSSSNDDHAL